MATEEGDPRELLHVAVQEGAFERAFTLITSVDAGTLDGAQMDVCAVARYLDEVVDRPEDAMEVLARLRASLTPTTPQARFLLWQVWFVRVELLARMHRFDEAEQACRAAIAVAHDYLGRAGEPYVDTVLRLAQLLNEGERYKEVIALLEPVKPLVETHFGNANWRYLNVTRYLAIAYDQSGDLAEAEPLFRDLLRIASYLHGPEHEATIDALYHIADLARFRGDFEEAEPLFRRALELQQASSRRDGLLATIQNNYAEMLADMGRVHEASALFEAALAVRADRFGRESTQVARSLMALARLDNSLDRHEEALARLEQAKAIYDQKGSGRARAAIDTLIANTRLHGKGGAPLSSDDIADVEKNVGAMAEQYGRHHPVLLQPLLHVARLRASKREWNEMRPVLLQAKTIADLQLIDTLRTATVRLAGVFAEQYREVAELWLALAVHDSAAAASDLLAAYECVQRRKGMQTRMLRLAQPGGDLVDVIDPYARPVSADSARERHAMTLRVIFEGGSTAPEELRQLRRQQDEWERRRARATPRGRIEAEMSADYTSAMFGVAEGTAIVELAVFTDPASKRRRYVAFVILAGESAPRLVPLGEADEIDKALRELRLAINQRANREAIARPEWLRLSRFLYNRLVKPWRQMVDGIQHLRIAPVDALALLPFEMLAAADDHFLIDDFRVSYLLLGSECFRLKQHFPLEGPPIVIADPDFGVADFGDGASPTGAHFTRLPRAREEGELVAARLGVEAYVGERATEAALLTAARPEIVHVATHGFVLGNSDGGALEDGYLARRARLPDALDRCGLAMAGANRNVNNSVPPPETEDGLLFASELLYSDFRRTDLVVLAACRSAEGDVVQGDMVYGLRRAFKAGGAHSIVCALWNVPDEIGLRMMTGFYDRLLAGVSRVDALHDVKVAIRNERPHEPYLWAGLILDGHTGPLRRLHPDSRFRFGQASMRGIGRWSEANDVIVAEQVGERRLSQALRIAATNPRKAVAMLDEVLAMPVSKDLLARSQYERAGILRKSDACEESLACYALLLADEDVPYELRIAARGDRATAFLQLGRSDDAVTDLTALLDSSSLDAVMRAKLLVRRSAAHLSASRYEDAIADTTTIIASGIAPLEQKRMALGNRATARRMTGDPRGAIDDADQALRLGEMKKPERLGFLWTRAMAAAALGDIASAEDGYDHLARELPAGSHALEQLRSAIAARRGTRATTDRG